MFCCDNGYCIDSKLRCDYKRHCVDNSDEKLDDCELIKVPAHYKPDRPPQPAERVREDDKTETLTEVRADLTILDILAIDDSSAVFKLFFTLELQWTDLNLNFCNLHQDQNYNILRDVSFYLIFI